MAVACSCKIAFERFAGGFEGVGARQTAGLNALKNIWPWRVAARVALEDLQKGLKGFGPGKRQAWTPSQKQMAVACSCESCLRKACGRV